MSGADWKKWSWVWLLPLFLAAAAGLAMATAHWLRPRVETALVIRGVAVDAVPGVVRIEAGREVVLRAENGGRVRESRLKPGLSVEAGQTLVWLDDRALTQAMEQVGIDLGAEEALQALGPPARFDLQQAREEWERKTGWHEAGRLSGDELTALRRRVERLEAEIEAETIRRQQRIASLRNERERLKGEREKQVLHAPVAGEILEVLAWPDDVLPPFGAAARLLPRERRVEASLSEENFQGVRAGQSATVRFLGHGARLFPARVERILPTANPDTQRYTVHLEVEIPEEMLVPGLTGEVSIVRGQREDTLVIPRRALIGNQVFVIRDGRAELRRVERGYISLNNVEITGGLREGDRVAVENLDRIRDGDRVRLKDHAP